MKKQASSSDPLVTTSPPTSWLMALPTLGMALMTGLVTYLSTGKVGLAILPMLAMGGMTIGVQMWMARAQHNQIEKDSQHLTDKFK